jgi:tetratricopeptide (TPR) repeat protein
VKLLSLTLACLLFAALPTVARADPPTRQAVQAAKEHFEHAKELYKTGAYREALVETETAHTLDLTAKELVYNLAVLHEKLGEIDEASANLRRYLQMNVDAAERERAEAYLRRLEGAKREVPRAQPERATPSATTPSGTPQPAEPGPSAPRGPRSGFSGAAIGTAVVSLAAIGVGAFFGVRALSDRPTGFVTGSNGTYADYEQRASNARREAAIADIAFGVGIVAALGAVYFAVSQSDSKTGAAVRVGGSW